MLVKLGVEKDVSDGWVGVDLLLQELAGRNPVEHELFGQALVGLEVEIGGGYSAVDLGCHCDGEETSIVEGAQGCRLGVACEILSLG